MKTRLAILFLLLSSKASAQTIFKVDGKFGLKDAKDSVVLISEYDTIFSLGGTLEDVPFFAIVRNKKVGIIIAKTLEPNSPNERTIWQKVPCAYDSIVQAVGHDDWRILPGTNFPMTPATYCYSIDLIKDGKHHFYGAGVDVTFPNGSPLFRAQDEDAVFKNIPYFQKSPNVYDSVLRFGHYEMYYNENGYKLYGFAPLKFRPDWDYVDSLGERKKLPHYDNSHGWDKEYLPHHLDFVSHIKDGKLSLVNWLGNQTPYDFEPEDQFGYNYYWLYTSSLNYPLRIFNRKELDEIDISKYVGTIYNTTIIDHILSRYVYGDNSFTMVLNPAYNDRSKLTDDLSYKDNSSVLFDLRFMDDDFTVIDFTRDTAIRYSKEGHRFEILNNTYHERNKAPWLIIPKDYYIADYNLEGTSENRIPFTLINMKTGRTIGAYSFKRRFTKIEVQEPHLDSLVQREYVEFFFKRRNWAFWISAQKNYQKKLFKSFAVYDEQEDKMYKSVKQWRRKMSGNRDSRHAMH